MVGGWRLGGYNRVLLGSVVVFVVGLCVRVIADDDHESLAHAGRQCRYASVTAYAPLKVVPLQDRGYQGVLGAVFGVNTVTGPLLELTDSELAVGVLDQRAGFDRGADSSSGNRRPAQPPNRSSFTLGSWSSLATTTHGHKLGRTTMSSATEAVDQGRGGAGFFIGWRAAPLAILPPNVFTIASWSDSRCWIY